MLATRDLFQSIEHSNYREVDIRIIYTYYQFFPIKQMFCVHKRNVSEETFLLSTQSMCFFIDSFKIVINGPYSLNPLCQKFIVFRKI